MAFLTFKEILELIDRVAERGIASVEVESASLKIRIEGKRPEGPAASLAESTTTFAAPAAVASPAAAGPAAAPAPPPEESEEGLYIVTSPIVGTFYRSANPEANPFVNPGDRISKGDVLCIIEAMKLMNEIEADIDGVLVKVFPQNGQPIEYGEKLFAVRVG